MREVLLKLEQVQEVDTQILSVRRKIDEMPKRLASYDLELKTHQAKYDDRKKIADEHEKNLRQQKGALELNESRLKRSQERLEQIKTNQEYQALQKEIESLKKAETAIQENAAKVEKESNTFREELAAIEVALNEVRARREAEANLMSGEEKGLTAELNAFLSQRAELTVGLDKRVLAMYEKIRDSRFGVGIVRAIAGNCKGCNVRIPPQMYNEIIRAAELHTCPSCRRLLLFHQEGAPSSGGAQSPSTASATS